MLIETEQRRRLEREATTRGTSVATLVRYAIDLAFPFDMDVRLGAAQHILEAPPMEVGEIDDLRGARR